MARLQLRIGLSILVDALGDYDLVEESLEWRQSLAFRGPTRLVVNPGTDS